MKSKRIRAGIYEVTTHSGTFTVWQEPVAYDDFSRRWFVNEKPDTLGETLTTSGFRTKHEAMKWLDKYVCHELSGHRWSGAGYVCSTCGAIRDTPAGDAKCDSNQ